MYKVYADGQLLFATGNPNFANTAILDPTLTTEINTAGELSFIVPKSNNLYDNIKLRLTTIEVKQTIQADDEDEVTEDDDTEFIVWRGRPIHVNYAFNGHMKVICEGSLAYLNDTVYPSDSNTMRLSVFLTKLIANHNDTCDANRQIHIGLFTMDDVEMEYNGSDTVTMEILQDLVDNYGGYIVPHETEGGSYFDWVKSMEIDAENVIDMTELVDISRDIDSEEVYTVVIPIGKDGLRLGCEFIENQIASNLFGKTWTAIEFNDIEDEDALYTAGEQWLQENMWSSLQLSITAADVGSDYKVGRCYLAMIQQFGVNHEVALVGRSCQLDDDAATEYTFSASTIFTQINDGRSISDVIDASKRIKTASQNALTAKTAKTEAFVEKATYYSGKIEFSDGTFLNVTKGLITGGKSSEGEF